MQGGTLSAICANIFPVTLNVKSLLDKTIFFCYAGLVVLTPLIYTTSTTELFEVPKMLIVYGLSTIVLTATLIKFIVHKKITLPAGPIIYTFLAFLAFQTLSTFFSIDKFTSIYGYPTRLNGGLISQFAYLLIFICALINLSKALCVKLLALSVLTGLAVSLWGIPSHFGYDPNCLVLTGQLNSTCWQAEFQPTLRIFSTLGQPNWLASYLVLLFPLSLAFLIGSKNNLNKTIYAACTFAIFLAFIFTNSRSGLAGMVTAIIILAALLGKKFLGKRLKIVLPIAAVVVLVSLVFGATLVSRLKEIQSGQSLGGTETSRIRQIVWTGAWQVFTQNPILGTGPETFAYSYQKMRPVTHNQTTEWNFFYNKAHNEFLNYLANIGIIGLLLYLSLLYLSLKTIYKIARQNISVIASKAKQSSPLEIAASPAMRGPRNDTVSLLAKGIIAAVIGYQVVILFGFSVVVTQTLMYLLVALALIFGNPKLKQINIKVNKFQSAGILVLILISGLWLLVSVFRLYFADAELNRAKNTYSPPDSIRAFGNSLLAFPTQNPFVASDFATYAAIDATSTDQPSGTYTKLADNLAQSSFKYAPNNFLVIRRLVNVYTLIGPQNQKYKTQGEKLAQLLVTLAPTDPQSYFTAAKFYAAVGNKSKTLSNLKKALNLKPDYVEAQDLYKQLTAK